jgi:hypothetical protein
MSWVQVPLPAPNKVNMTSPTTHKGNIGQAAVALEALKRGYHVSTPFEGAAYDLIIDRAGSLSRVQVKYSKSDGKRLKVRLRDYTPHDIDAIAAYDGTTGKVYWLPIDMAISSDTVNLRLTPPENGQETGIIWASTFEVW